MRVVFDASSTRQVAASELLAVQRLGKQRLLRDFSCLVDTDRGNTAAMLVYIGEINRRKLYLEHSYPSMFAFCTKRFQMSEAVAAKRIRAGRAACRFPCILEMVRRGELHLSGAHQLAAHLTESNHRELLRRAKHRSMREIEELIAEVSPKPDARSSIRALPTQGADVDGRRPPSDSRSNADRARQGMTDGTLKSVSNCSNRSMQVQKLGNRPTPLSPRRYKLQVTIGQEARDTLTELQNLLSHQIPTGDPALVVERALQALLRETKKKRAAVSDKPPSKRKKESVSKKKSAQRTRGIPAWVRREVFKRDGGRCAFVNREGRRCESGWQLEFHHCVPYARDGPHTVGNVELRCRAHNQYEAELELGRTFMETRRRRRESANSRPK